MPFISLINTILINSVKSLKDLLSPSCKILPRRFVSKWVRGLFWGERLSFPSEPLRRFLTPMTHQPRNAVRSQAEACASSLSGTKTHETRAGAPGWLSGLWESFREWAHSRASVKMRALCNWQGVQRIPGGILGQGKEQVGKPESPRIPLLIGRPGKLHALLCLKSKAVQDPSDARQHNTSLRQTCSLRPLHLCSRERPSVCASLEGAPLFAHLRTCSVNHAPPSVGIGCATILRCLLCAGGGGRWVKWGRRSKGTDFQL